MDKSHDEEENMGEASRNGCVSTLKTLIQRDRWHDEGEKMVALYQASLNGCVSTFNTLIQKDPLILHKVSLTSFGETPLHIAALLGHVEFSKILVNKKPKLAEEVDSLGRTPLHLASAEGHTKMVEILLQANTDVCLVFDQDGRIPLHLAAMRGRIEIIKDLIYRHPNSIRENLNGESVLHLCVRYNHLNALKLLVKSANGDKSFLSSKDHDGNSILHLAVMLKQIEAIKYLLSVPQIKSEANAMNMIGYTPLDALELCPRDFKCFEVQNILKEAGVRKSTILNSSPPPTSTLNDIGVDESQPAQSVQPDQSSFTGWRKYVCSPLVYVHSSLVKLWNQFWNQKDLIEKTHETLSLMATVIATVTFQGGISPPGGVLQENITGSSNCMEDTCEAGTTLLAYTNPDAYHLFLSFNTISFFTSVSVLLLVIIGFPLQSKFFTRLLTLGMSTTVLFMTLTYVWAVLLVTPHHIIPRAALFCTKIAGIWVVVALVALGMYVCRKLQNFKRKPTAGSAEVHAV